MARRETIRIGVAGAFGRMGREVIAEVGRRPSLGVAALIVHGPRGGADPDRPIVTAAEALDLCDVIVDFTSGRASAGLAELASRRGRPSLVIGSTGFSADEEAKIVEAGGSIAIVRSGNFSRGVTVLAELARQAARRLDASEWDIEIFEAHHKNKRDAPSGTALALGAAAAAGRSMELADVAVFAPRGPSRPAGAIGFAVARAGGIVGEHQVIYAAEGEIVTLSHSARDRAIFAKGAVDAAVWVVERPPGLYEMRDVLGLGA